MTKKNDIRRTVLLAGSIALLLPAGAAEVQKANNANALAQGTSWSTGVVPTAADIALFNNTLTAANTSQFGGNLSLDGIKMLNPGGHVILADNVAVSGNTLTLGASGVDMSAATFGLQVQSRVALAAPQTWNVADSVPGVNAFGFNFSEDLSFAAQANSTPFDLGGFAVTKAGPGTAVISSGYLVENGTFNVNAGVLAISGAGSRPINVGTGVTFNVATGGTLRFQGASGATNVNGTINLTGGTVLMTSSNATNAATINGPVNVTAASTILLANPQASATSGPSVINGNISGSAPLNLTNTTTTITFLRLGGDNSGYTGTVTLGGTAGHATRLISASAGSANATWVVNTGNNLEVDGVTVQLGRLNGDGMITNSNASVAAAVEVGAGDFTGAITDGAMPMGLVKTGTGTLTLSGFNTYSGATGVTGGTLLATPGSLGTTAVTVGNGAGFGVRLVTPGSTLAVSSATTGTGSALAIDLGSLGNPTAATMAIGNLTVQAPTVLRLIGSNLSVGSFPLVSYTTIGGLGANGVSLVLPPRVLGTLVKIPSQFSVNITGFDAPKWTGSVNGKWDIDNGTGTANWREINSGNSTRYIQTANGSDSVRFDDSATGITNVELTTALLPNGIVVDNTTRDYTFFGTGKISGSRGLTKSGTGTLRIRNSGINDYTGETVINAGTLEIGDGATANVGTLGTGAITNNGTLVLNRPDAFTVSPTITGAGGITKNGGGLATLSAAVTQSGPVVLSGGGLAFGGGGMLSGPVTGAGLLAVTAGTFELSGADANTFTGGAAVNAGTLRLNKSPGVNAVGGNVTITGGGILVLAANEQIPDSATVTFTGTSADSLAGSTGTETVANVVVNPSVATGQFIMRNNFTVSGLATVQNGILGIGSGQTATVNAINISGGSVRIAGNTAASTLHVGTGGITASGGIMEVKFGVTDQDAVVELGGDFTATGNFAITNANYTGPNLSRINLNGNRTFNIATGTTTTVAPEIAGTGGLTKTGAGTLDLLGRAATYAGATTITAGTLRTVSTQSGTSGMAIADAGNLVLRIPVAGTSLATQTLTLGSTSGTKVTFDLNGLGNPTAAPLTTNTFTSTGANTLAILGAVTPGTFPLIDYTGAITGGFASLNLQLPLRVAGSLVNNTASSRVDVNILGTDTPRWNGNLSAVWDVDNGTGTGTANWRGLFTGNPTRYLQGAGGIDSVIFDDSATGATNVNLGTTLTPVNATVNNTTKTYTFSGANKLGGTSVLTKEGTGTLILANTTAYDHTGGTVINGGTLQVGDGATAGAGILPTTTITNNAMLLLNRPDDFDIAATFAAASTGTLVKNRPNTASFVSPAVYPGPVAINAGTLKFVGGGNLSGPISGAGQLVVDGATLQLSGFEANTLAGTTTVVSGALQLNKTGVDAIAGTIELQGSGSLTLTQANQIGDTARLIFNKTAGNQVIGNETIGALDVINGNEAVQMQANNGLVVTGLLTMSSGIFGVASNHSASVGGINMSGGILRIAANSNPSTLTVGPSGITASGGVIQVGQGAGAFDGLLELRGNVTTTGTLGFTDGNFTGTQKREINLGDTTRVFNIAEATTTTIAPDLTGTGGLTKTGTGTLTLSTANASSYSGETNVEAGTLVANGSLAGSARINVRSGATLSGSGNIAAPSTLLAGSKLAPGETFGTLTFANTVDLVLAVASPATGALLFDLDPFGTSDAVFITGGALSIGTGTLEFNDFTFNASADLSSSPGFTLFDTDRAITGTLGAAVEGVINGSPFRLQLADGGKDLVLVPVPEPASASLLLTAAGLLGACRRRRQSRVAKV